MSKNEYLSIIDKVKNKALIFKENKKAEQILNKKNQKSYSMNFLTDDNKLNKKMFMLDMFMKNKVDVNVIKNIKDKTSYDYVLPSSISNSKSKIQTEKENYEKLNNLIENYYDKKLEYKDKKTNIKILKLFDEGNLVNDKKIKNE